MPAPIVVGGGAATASSGLGFGQLAGLGALGSLTDFGLGQISSAISWKRQKKILKNQIQWRVNDMRKAGINPLLAVTSGTGSGANVPVMSAGGTANSALAFAQAKRALQTMDAEIYQKEMSGKESEGRTTLYRAQQALTDQEKRFNEQYLEPWLRARAEFDKNNPDVVKAGRLMEYLSPFVNSAKGLFLGGKR